MAVTLDQSWFSTQATESQLQTLGFSSGGSRWWNPPTYSDWSARWGGNLANGFTLAENELAAAFQYSARRTPLPVTIEQAAAAGLIEGQYLQGARAYVNDYFGRSTSYDALAITQPQYNVQTGAPTGAIPFTEVTPPMAVSASPASLDGLAASGVTASAAAPGGRLLLLGVAALAAYFLLRGS